MTRSQTQSQPVISKVAEGKSEFTFELTLRGKWDWNKDIAGPVPGDTYNCSFLTPYTIKEKIDGRNLESAFQSQLADHVFDRCERMFDSAHLHNVTFSPDMQAAYLSVRQALSGADRLAAEQELKAAEEKAARLRKQLGK